jgi:predicted Zn-dependent protease
MNLLIRLLLIIGLGLAPVTITQLHAFGLDDLNELEKKVKKEKKKADKLRGKVSVKEEIKIGENLISGLLGAAPLVADPGLQRYVNDVGFWVASQSARKKLPWRFGVIQSDGINAFAAPGGQIVLTLGLYSLLQNEAQLAAVLAHEIAHVVRKHHLKALQKTMKRSFWSGVALGAVDNDESRKKLEGIVNAGVQLYTTGLDRKLEYDADLRAVVLAARAGYDAYALLDVLTTIDSISPESEDVTVLMKTHPSTTKRLDKLASRMDGKMAAYASGKSNLKRFLQASKNR